MPLLFWANGRGDATAAPFVPVTAHTYYCPLRTYCIEIFLYLDRDCLFLSLSLLLLSGLIWNTEVVAVEQNLFYVVTLSDGHLPLTI